jgi:hypothetical protein
MATGKPYVKDRRSWVEILSSTNQIRCIFCGAKESLLVKYPLGMIIDFGRRHKPCLPPLSKQEGE